MTPLAEVGERGILEILHFTTNRGLVGTLAKGELLSRRRLPSDSYLEHILHANVISRPEEAQSFDKSNDWLDFVNLSISEINESFFQFSKNWPHNQELWWAILAFDPEILMHTGVHFATTNNSYEHCKRGIGLNGFQPLFAASIRRKGTWVAHRYGRASYLPTCQQAEVLYPGAVSLRCLKRIYVSRGEERDCVRGWLREFGYPQVDVVLDSAKFAGKPN